MDRKTARTHTVTDPLAAPREYLNLLYYVGPPVKALGLKQYLGPFLLEKAGQDPWEAVPLRYKRIANIEPFFRNLFVSVRDMPTAMKMINNESSPIAQLRARAKEWLADEKNKNRLKA